MHWYAEQKVYTSMQSSAPSWYDTGRALAGLLQCLQQSTTYYYGDDNVDYWWLSNYQSETSGKTPHSPIPMHFRHSSYLADDLAWKHCISVFLIFVFLKFLLDLHIVNCWADSTVDLSNSADLGPSSGHSWCFRTFLAFFFLFLPFLGISSLALLSLFSAFLGTPFLAYLFFFFTILFALCTDNVVVLILCDISKS